MSFSGRMSLYIKRSICPTIWCRKPVTDHDDVSKISKSCFISELGVVERSSLKADKLFPVARTCRIEFSLGCSSSSNVMWLGSACMDFTLIDYVTPLMAVISVRRLRWWRRTLFMSRAYCAYVNYSPDEQPIPPSIYTNTGSVYTKKRPLRGQKFFVDFS